jgi:hypothetical protein
MPNPVPMTPSLADLLGFKPGAATGTPGLDLARSGTSEHEPEGTASTPGRGLPTQGPGTQAGNRSGDRG